MISFLLFWIGLAVVIGVAASHRGRSGFGWGLLSLIISPILTGLLLLALPRVNALDDIATLALIESTPEGSRSRQLFAEREAKLAHIKQERSAASSWLLGSSSTRPWSPRSSLSSPTNYSFIVGMSIWTVFLLGGLAMVILH